MTNSPDTTTVSEKIALWADQLRDHSAMGLRFSENIYDRTRYEAIQQIALDMYALATGIDDEQLETVRAMIFSRPTPITVGDGAVIDASGRILLIQRSDSQLWAMPGGALEVGETPAAGVVREVLEETGVRCEATTLVGVFDTRLWGSKSGHQLYNMTFLCRPLDGRQPITHDMESLAIGWYPEDGLPDATDPGHRGRIHEAFRIWRGDPHSHFDP